MKSEMSTQRIHLQAQAIEWQEYSPGIAVKMFRQHESGGMTLLAQYAPGSSFVTHRHPGGEEIYVIEGVLSDDEGEYPAGSYLYSPPGSVHRTWSDLGCTILVVLPEMVEVLS